MSATIDNRQRLLEAAEHLFATRGIDAVSLAEITSEAGLNNTGAVHYYFGGREELLQAIVDEHRAELDLQRDALFDELEAAGDTELASLVRVLIMPLVDKLDDPRGRAFLSIQAQRQLRPRPAVVERRPLALRLLRLLGIPDVPGPIAEFVHELAMLLVFGALAQRAEREEAMATVELDRHDFVEHLVAAIVRLHKVPPAPPLTKAKPRRGAKGRR
jgi:AcrR family transcriptional regulator